MRAKYCTSAASSTTPRRAFQSIPAANPYYFQARYFLATIRCKQRRPGRRVGDLRLDPQAAAAGRLGKDIQDLARLALGRILYERSQFDRAIEAYASVPRTVAVLRRGPVRAGVDVHQGQGVAEGLSCARPAAADRARTRPRRPSCGCSMGNLQLRMSNFYLASDSFSKVARRVRADSPPAAAGDRRAAARSRPTSTTLVGKSLDKFDIATFIPPTAAKWVQGRSRRGPHADRSPATWARSSAT